MILDRVYHRFRRTGQPKMTLYSCWGLYEDKIEEQMIWRIVSQEVGCESCWHWVLYELFSVRLE
jgi:hypothetical protein